MVDHVSPTDKLDRLHTAKKTTTTTTRQSLKTQTMPHTCRTHVNSCLCWFWKRPSAEEYKRRRCMNVHLSYPIRVPRGALLHSPLPPTSTIYNSVAKAPYLTHTRSYYCGKAIYLNFSATVVYHNILVDMSYKTSSAPCSQWRHAQSCSR